LPRTK